MSHIYDRAGEVVRAIYDRRIDTPATLPVARFFPNAQRYIDKWTDIRREALAIAGMLEAVPRFEELLPEQANISTADGRDWRMFPMKAYGVALTKNLRRCPTVAALVEETPEVVSAVISFLAPGKHIPEHRGPFRGILRFHLMLSMPCDAGGEPACVMNVDGVPYRLGDGESLLWDDTFPHEVWNRSDQVRIALLLDVWRKDMPTDVAVLSNAIYAAVNTMMRVRGVSYIG